MRSTRSESEPDVIASASQQASTGRSPSPVFTASTGSLPLVTAQTQVTASNIQSLVNGQSEALKQALDAAYTRVAALEADNARLKGQA